MDIVAHNVGVLTEAASNKVQWPKWALAMLFLSNGVGFGTWATHVPVFKQSLHIENGTLTLVLTSFIVGAIVSMPIAGQLIARYGSRRITRIAAIGYVLAIGLLAQASSFLLFLIFAGLLGAANGALDIAMNANAVAIEKHYMRSSMCLFQGCWSAGGLLGATAAGLMLKHQGTALTDLSFIASLLALFCIVSLPILVDDVARPSRSEFVWPDSALFRIAILAAFGLLAEGAIADWASVYLHSNLGVTLPLAAAGYAAYAVSMTAARFSGDWLTRRFSEKNILHASGLLIAIGITCTLLSPSWWPAVLGLVLAGAGIANIVPVIFGMAGHDTRMGSGPAISAVATIGYFALLTGPPIIGSLAVLVGLRRAMIVIVLAGIIVAAGPVFFRLALTSSVAREENL
jgi:MFS family permease